MICVATAFQTLCNLDAIDGESGSSATERLAIARTMVMVAGQGEARA